MKAIQNKVPFPLWVSIPHIINDLPIPVGLGVYVNNARDELKNKYGVNVEKHFFGGHSLGGASVAGWVKSNAKEAEAVFLLGSYIGKSIKDPAANYGAPVLTVGAEFDGWMARITRIAQSFDQMKASSIGYKKSKYSYPVVLIPGSSHASFLMGVPPAEVQRTDLRATISNEEAIEKTSDAVSAFFTITRFGKEDEQSAEAVKVIDHLIDDISEPYLQPIADFFYYEGAPFMSHFSNSTPWVELTQQLVAGNVSRDAGVDLMVTDEWKTEGVVTGEFEHAKPSISKNESDGSINIKAYSHPAYDFRTSDWIDAADYYCATEVGAKFKSREAIYKYLNVSFEG